MGFLQRTDFRNAFMQASQSVLDLRDLFQTEYGNAQKDSDRYRLEKQFLEELSKRYEFANRILDDYLASTGR